MPALHKHRLASAFALGLLAFLPLTGCGPRKDVKKFVIGNDTPIKVGGGATTFYSFQPWSPVGTNAFCTSISGITSVELDGFDNGVGTQSFSLPATAWTLSVKAHRELVTLQSQQPSCSGGILVTFPSRNGYYPSPLPRGHANERLLSKCEDVDEDVCERTHSATLSTDSVQHICDDLDCWIEFRRQ